MINGGAREMAEGKEEGGSGPPGAEWADVEEGPAVPTAPGVSPAPLLFSQCRQPSPVLPAPPHSQPAWGRRPLNCWGASPGPLAHTG